MDKLCIITGASRGIGLSTAKLFLHYGWQVINISRTAVDNDRIISIEADISTKDTSWQDALKLYLLNKRIVLVHNAAMCPADQLQSVDMDTFRQTLELNVMAPLRLNQVVLPFMEADSAIIYIGSTLSEIATSNTFSYVISKHALLGMMRATCQDLAHTGIHTACVCPGFTNTEILRVRIAKDSSLEQVMTNNAFDRIVEPGEVAKVIYFAATNPVVNNGVLHANLGQIQV